MSWVVALMGLIGAVLAWECYRKVHGHDLALAERERSFQNARVRQIHAKAGNVWYPHVMADRTVRWYRVDHAYAVDL